jgi:hypothetical protein
MIKLDITLDSTALNNLMAAVQSIAEENGFPATHSAFEQGAAIIKKTWQGYAMGAPLPGVSPLSQPSAKYAGSIRIEKHGPFEYSIVSNSEMAERIENGTPELDMKLTHPYGEKGRVAKKRNKDGSIRYVPYLIIPLRWGTPRTASFRSIMPDSVYKIVSNKNFQKSKVSKEIHVEDNFWGDNVERREYTWGDRLSGSDTDTDFGNAEGMVRMNNGGGYFTFRVISADSPAGSWIRPAVPARAVTAAVVAHISETVNDLVQSGIMEDVQ